MFDARFSMFGLKTPTDTILKLQVLNIKTENTNTEHRKPNIENNETDPFTNRRTLFCI
jgi:hypothetical protein